MILTPTELMEILADLSGNFALERAEAGMLEAGFGDLGIDSLTLVETAIRLERDHTVRIPDDELPEFRTPAELLERINTTGTPTPMRPSTDPPAIVDKSLSTMVKAWVRPRERRT
ncbi:MAG TPA: acyl carrier protein [Amycolatopsis sp.]|nr:acyl carrier protein [Amycolatopsis sp.]